MSRRAPQISPEPARAFPGAETGVSFVQRQKGGTGRSHAFDDDPCGADGPVGLRAASERSAFAVPISAGEGAIEVMRGAGPRMPIPRHAMQTSRHPRFDRDVTEQVMLQPPQIGTDGIVPGTRRLCHRDAAAHRRGTARVVVRDPMPVATGRSDFIASMQRAPGDTGGCIPDR